METPGERILLSHCDGAGCAGLAACNCGMAFDRYIAVEADDITTVICDNVNSGHDDFPDPDHYWNNNVMDIPEDEIQALGYNVIKVLTWGAPCEDMSLLRLIRQGVCQVSSDHRMDHAL